MDLSGFDRGGLAVPLNSDSYPPTIIIVHERENSAKCSVQPLRGRPGFTFHKFPLRDRPDLDNYVRLGIGGPLLGPADVSRGLLVLDATWRLAEKMELRFAEVPVRSLPVAQTAYPRVSKVFDDPQAGLATIEAIYLAYRLLGRDTGGLFDQYRWGDKFLSINGPLLGARQ